MDPIIEMVESIVGTPSTDYESLALYVVACFIFIVAFKLCYDLITNIFGIKS